MSVLAEVIGGVLREGADHLLFSGAAAAVRVGSQRATVSVGTREYGSDAPVTDRSLFDLASITKSYVAAAVMVLVDRGEIDLDAPVDDHLPVGSGLGSEKITTRMLLSHTAGLPATSEVWKDRALSPGERLPTVLTTRLETVPGEVFQYSCLGYIAVGAFLEQVTGHSLGTILAETILRPLGLTQTRFGPVEPDRALATETQDSLGRAMVRGEVHDELSSFLGGEVGNAGLFATADDVLDFVVGLTDGTVISPRAMTEMTTSALRPSHGSSFGHGLGVRLGDRNSMGSARGFGHTGFTGTLWLSDPEDDIDLVLLTNRVHPRRDVVRIVPFREKMVEAVRRSVTRGG